MTTFEVLDRAACALEARLYDDQQIVIRGGSPALVRVMCESYCADHLAWATIKDMIRSVLTVAA